MKYILTIAYAGVPGLQSISVSYFPTKAAVEKAARSALARMLRNGANLDAAAVTISG